MFRDSADRVVGEKGTYEELIACSHEIAASTAQLVAASKVQTHVKHIRVGLLGINIQSHVQALES